MVWVFDRFDIKFWSRKMKRKERNDNFQKEVERVHGEAMGSGSLKGSSRNAESEHIFFALLCRQVLACSLNRVKALLSVQWGVTLGTGHMCNTTRNNTLTLLSTDYTHTHTHTHSDSHPYTVIYTYTDYTCRRAHTHTDFHTHTSTYGNVCIAAIMGLWGLDERGSDACHGVL